MQSAQCWWSGKDKSKESDTQVERQGLIDAECSAQTHKDFWSDNGSNGKILYSTHGYSCLSMIKMDTYTILSKNPKGFTNTILNPQKLK